MGILAKLFGKSPFGLLVEHTKKVHDVVKYVDPLIDALLAGDHDRLRELQHEVSKTEHEADTIKSQIRDNTPSRYLMAVSREDIMHFLGRQDDVADAAEDFAVVLSLRRTKVHPDLHEDLKKFAAQVIKVSRHLLVLAEELDSLAEAGFSGANVKKALASIEQIGQEEWESDKLQRAFARHYYDLEQDLDPVTIMFYDKICRTLSDIANKAENAAKFLRLLILHR